MRSTVCEGLVGAVDALVALVLDGSALDGSGLDGWCVAELQHLTGQVADVKGRLAGVEVALLGALEARSGGKVPSEPVCPPEPTPAAGDTNGGDTDTDPGAEAAAAAAAAAAEPAPGPAVLVQHWLRDRTGCDGGEAGRQVRLAVELRGLPLVLAAVLDGRLSLAHARVLCRLVGQIDPAALAEAEPNLLAVAAERDPVELAAYVRHQLATWCEPQFEADQRAQEQRRYLQTWREAGGMLAGRFRLTSTDSEELLTLLEPLARPSGIADSRSAGQRRADALSEICRQVLGFGQLPDAGGFRPQVSYVVPAAWAAGQGPAGSSPVGTFADLIGSSLAASVLGDQRACIPLSDWCAVGAWSGPQTRSHIETILCDARLTRVLLDLRGQVTGLETVGNTITNAHRRALAARDKGCAVRGCTRPPACCDAHHLDHRADGGSTDVDNLVLLCRRHHTLWHQGRLTLHQLHVPWIDGTHDPPL